jgi:hypothetical protein
MHNDQGARARNSKSKTTLDRFHQWQRNHFDPVNEAALNELNRVKSQLQAEDPERYGRGADQLTDTFLPLKMRDRLDTTWDSVIDLRDVALFEDGR